jgi:polysaccharide export outer membrane protein
MNYKLYTLFLISALFLNSCSSVKNVAYFQKVETGANPSIQQTKSSDTFDARIKPKDMLSITVVTSEPLASRNYNLIMPQILDASSTNNNLTVQPALQTYLVDNDGTIDFPVFGKLTVKGLTRKELESMLQAKLASSFSNERPIVTIRITNFTVNVLGEVQRPGKFNSTNERMTIYEGLALAGDLTIYGMRENVKVLRENADGTKSFITINLTDENSIHSPGYYLEQNDVVYVEPNKTKARTSRIGSAETLGISALSIVISMASLVINILK